MSPGGVPRLVMLVTVLMIARPSSCTSIDHDVQMMAEEAAGPGAIDCGFANGNDLGAPRPEDVRACVLDALAAGDAFFASASPATADGGTVVGYASDGTALRHIVQSYVLSMVGCDSEDVFEEACVALVDKGPGCGSGASDLCLDCEAAP